MPALKRPVYVDFVLPNIIGAIDVALNFANFAYAVYGFVPFFHIQTDRQPMLCMHLYLSLVCLGHECAFESISLIFTMNASAIIHVE